MSTSNCLECARRAADAVTEGKVGYFICDDCYKREELGQGPALPSDRVRLHVAMFQMARALALNWTTVDASRPDHELLEEIGAAVTPALAGAFRLGYIHMWDQTERAAGSLFAEYDDRENIYLNGMLDGKKT